MSEIKNGAFGKLFISGLIVLCFGWAFIAITYKNKYDELKEQSYCGSKGLEVKTSSYEVKHKKFVIYCE